MEEESSKNSLIEGVEFWKDSTQSAFKPSPKVLNGIELRRIWRKENEVASRFLGKTI